MGFRRHNLRHKQDFETKGKGVKMLFIGGLSDGLRSEIPEWGSTEKQIHIYHSQLYRFAGETYRVHRFVSSDGTAHHVMVHSSVTDTMKALIDGYRSP